MIERLYELNIKLLRSILEKVKESIKIKYFQNNKLNVGQGIVMQNVKMEENVYFPNVLQKGPFRFFYIFTTLAVN